MLQPDVTLDPNHCRLHYSDPQLSMLAAHTSLAAKNKREKNIKVQTIHMYASANLDGKPKT